MGYQMGHYRLQKGRERTCPDWGAEDEAAKHILEEFPKTTD